MNDAEIKSREKAIFEAGIKLGALYHQFTGSPVSPESVDSLEYAIEESIKNQPYVESISVKIDSDLIEENLNRFGYTELTGLMLDVDLTVKVGNTAVRAGIEVVDGYPLMALSRIE
ncbi:MAG: dihydroneopterin aldolase family protein [Candidatus Syntropharchaeales archaeon]